MRIIIIKKRNLLVLPILLILIITSVLTYNKQYNTIPAFSSPIINKVIAIDPGHGGFDPGASGKSGVKEDDINLQICLRIRRLLEQAGGIVILTRETDDGLDTSKSKTIRQRKNEDLRNRRILINESKPNVFVSIHLNSFEQAKYHGAQVFYKNGCSDSKELADIVQKELRRVLDKNNKRVPQSRKTVYLLKMVKCPSILVECGFLSNANEEKMLQDPSYQEKIAWAIYIGLLNYFDEERENQI
ncbi:N-acetylmuramoyl-L-alanine amidase CwlD [Abyssisolibacter fermentans]|uniref:N-acetylmuramoyl-L-alanine amidase CwlD n=1 Tax=Abyssisolibacter fermentans TaxID=1766203 RepID=UPI0008295F00|nr:N-acetylmuramoyl-L-alanine amidase CwlD [Abyssisolibacter fermentans]